MYVDPYVSLVAPCVLWWANVFGSVFDCLGLWLALGLPWRNAFRGALVANAVSALLLAIPLNLMLYPGLLIFLNASNPFPVNAFEEGIDVSIPVVQILYAIIVSAIEIPILCRFGLSWNIKSAIIVYISNYTSIVIFFAISAINYIFPA
jgi:hypothetical protein